MSSRLIPVAVLASAMIASSVAPSQAAAGGSLTLYGNTDFTGPVAVLHYATCSGGPASSGSQIGSFDNSPPPDCEVVLTDAAGERQVLCVGRGVVPAAYRHPIRLTIQPGTVVVPCDVAMR